MKVKRYEKLNKNLGEKIAAKMVNRDNIQINFK